MTREDLIKQAYCHGASVALTEAGFEKQAAEKIAHELMLQKLALEMPASVKSLLEKITGGMRRGASKAGLGTGIAMEELKQRPGLLAALAGGGGAAAGGVGGYELSNLLHRGQE